MSLVRKLAGETAIYGVSNILNRLLSFIIATPYLTREFNQNKELYGLHGLMYALAGFLLVMLTYGLETAYFRFTSREENKDKVFSTASTCLAITTVAIAALLILFAQPIAAAVSQPAHYKYIIYVVIFVAFDVLCAIPFAQLRLQNRPIRFAFFKAIFALIYAGLILFFLELSPRLLEKGVDFVANFYRPDRKLHYVFLANIIASGTIFLLLLPKYFQVKFDFDKDLLKRMLKYAAPLLIVGLAGMTNQLADRFMINGLLPGTAAENLQQLGIYNACIKIAYLMYLFTQAFKYAAEPFFFRYADKEDAHLIYAKVGHAFSLTGSITFLGIMLYLDFFQFLIGSGYRDGLGIVPIILLAYLFFGIYYTFSMWYKLKDKTHIGAYISIGGAIITLLVNYILIPKIGYYGAAWASLSCFLFMTVMSYIVGQRHYKIPYPVGKMIFFVVLAIVFYLISEFIRPYLGKSIGLVLSVNTVLMVAYLLMIYLFDGKFLREVVKGEK